MPEPELISIWPVGTGILPLAEDLRTFRSDTMDAVLPKLSEIKSSHETQPYYTSCLEEINREFAIETGVIEGLYDLERGVTESLIHVGFEATEIAHGKASPSPEVARALIENHRDGLELVFTFIKGDRELTIGFIKELHAVMTRSQRTVLAQDLSGRSVEVEMIHGDWKKLPNNPKRNGSQFFYCPPEHVQSEMERLLALDGELSVTKVSAEVRAAWLHHRFSQIHPFQDGNGRVARALASIVLIKEGLLPLVVESSKKTPYLDCLELADAGDLRPLCSLFAWFQEIAVLKLWRAIGRKGTANSVAGEADLAAASVTQPEIPRTERLRNRFAHIHKTWLQASDQAYESAFSYITKTGSKPFNVAQLREPAMEVELMKFSDNPEQHVEHWTTFKSQRSGVNWARAILFTGVTSQIAVIGARNIEDPMREAVELIAYVYQGKEWIELLAPIRLWTEETPELRDKNLAQWLEEIWKRALRAYRTGTIDVQEP